MDDARDRALTLAHEAELKEGRPQVRDVLTRAAAYLDFLVGKHDSAVGMAERVADSS